MDVIPVPNEEHFNAQRKLYRLEIMRRLNTEDVSEWIRDEEADDIYLVIKGKKYFYDDLIDFDGCVKLVAE